MIHGKNDVLAPKGDVAAFRSTFWVETGADGLYGRTGEYEKVLTALDRLVSDYRPATAEVFRFPPVMSRRTLQKAGYLKSFPHLLGCVSCLSGDEEKIRSTVSSISIDDDLTPALESADLVLTPAACYPVYPLAAARGAVGSDGLAFDIGSDCFRHEPSKNIDRLQSFRMREFVRIGTPDQVKEFRGEWVKRAQDLAGVLGLTTTVDVASDPFFGRGGQLAAMSQLQQSLKFELLIPIRSIEEPTACMSFNYHLDHFGEIWDLRNEAGEIMHTACVAFGMDRLVVALFITHGFDLAAWPKRTLTALGL